ncbi:MAG TPA: cytochrome c [Methylomirabilota bacterium]|jgi:cytochrome c556|nr:cytochrome c [Methylomirabilota bacterium]
MNAVFVRAAVVVVGITSVVGCASMRRMNPDEAIAARQQLMKEQGAAMKSISDKVKAGQIQAVAVDAQKLEDTAKQIPKLFPENSVNPSTSRAKPEIWQKWSDFEGYTKSLETKARQLEASAKAGDGAATQAQATDLGKTTCGACHTSFRGPEIKK